MIQKKWRYSFAFFLAALIAIFLFFLIVLQGFIGQSRMEKENEILLRNELNQLVQNLQENPEDPEALYNLNIAIEKIENTSSTKTNQFVFLFAGIGFLALFIIVVFLWIYLKIIRPFQRLENFAQEIAKGNFTPSLPIERTNIFGSFSWAFDVMRTELDFAKKEEESARENNKLLIASISHDIKTPISSIRAYTEALQHNMDTKEGRREKYLSVIIQKADEVATLTNDLFLHALSDMEKLEIKPERVRALELFQDALKPYQAQYPEKIKMIGFMPNRYIYADARRTQQVIDNIIMNIIKYAPESDIEISFQEEEASMKMLIRDFGKGIPPEDMPFVCNKLYRGRNVGEKPGAGLGLYIAKDIMEKSKGKLSLLNCEKGLVVELLFPIATI